jgi:hypothetical protein
MVYVATFMFQQGRPGVFGALYKILNEGVKL